MIRVLFFVASVCGGSERMTVNIALSLNTKLFEPIFVIVGNQTRADIEEFIPPNYQRIYLSSGDNQFRMIIKMMNILKQYHPDVIFCSLFHISIRLIIANIFTIRKRLIARCNTQVNRLKFSSRKSYYLGKFIYGLADVIVAQTDSMHKDIIDYLFVSKSKVVTIYNPIDEKTISDGIIGDSPFENVREKKIIQVARVSEAKDQITLIKAFVIVLKKGVDANLYIVGDDYTEIDYYNKLQSLIVEEKIQDKVFFLGIKENPYIWVKYSDCFVLTSPVEGLPNALIEASFIGIPVVSTDCVPIIHEIVQEGVNGYIVDVGDYNSIADKIIKCFALGKVNMTYQPGRFDDFAALFYSTKC